MIGDISNRTSRVALYWDFENLHISVWEQMGGTASAELRYKPNPAVLDVDTIMDYARSLGTVCVNRAYANWSLLGRYQSALSSNGFSLVQTFPTGAHSKNGSDIQLCVDLIEDLFRLQYDICVIVSGDSDFIGAAQKAKMYGKRIIGIGVRGRTNRHLQRVCDEFKFYDALAPRAPTGVTETTTSYTSTLSDARKLLVNAVARLASQSGEPWVLKSRVKPMMLRLEPTFDERTIAQPSGAIGYASFSHFTSECGDVIEEEPNAADSRMRLRDGVSPKVAPTPLPSPKTFSGVSTLVVAAMTLLARRSDPIMLSNLKPMMRKLDPVFDERIHGTSSFLSFVERMGSVVAICGEGERRTVKLLVEPSLGPYAAPPEPAPLIERLPPSATVLALVPMHFELRRQPCPDWPAYYHRLNTTAESCGVPLDRTAAQAVKTAMFKVGAFDNDGPFGAISLSARFETCESLRAEVADFLENLAAATKAQTPTASMSPLLASTPPCEPASSDS